MGEVVDVFDQSLGQDENGSVYPVLPGVPTLDFPNVNKFLLLASAIAGKLVVLCRPQTKLINATHIFMILMLAFFGLNPFISGVLFHHYLFDGDLEVCCLVVEFSSDVNVSGPCAHSTSCDQASFNQLVGVVTHNLSVLASSWLSFVCVDDEVLWSAVVWLVHEGPLHARGEAGAAPTPQTAHFDLVDDPVGALVHDLLCLVPVTPLHGSFESPVMPAVEVLKDPVLICQGTELCFGWGRFCWRLVGHDRADAQAPGHHEVEPRQCVLEGGYAQLADGGH